jgi:hypothetical protein
MNSLHKQAENGDTKMKKFLMTIALTGLLASTLLAGPKSTFRNQQQRIGQGVRSGQLTPRETAKLERREHSINQETRVDRSLNGGHLTDVEKAKISAQRQNLSRQIYADKHNAAQDHFGNGEVGRREQRQQNRIAQGIQSGRMNANEASHVERREAGVQSEVRADRAANGGRLTRSERRAVNNQQDRLSRTIYTDKHN